MPIEETSASQSFLHHPSANKISGQYVISELCGKSQIPPIKIVEGAVLSSTGDSDVNCSVTFKTKSSQQHFAIRFEQLKLGCDDHLKLIDGDVDYGPLTIKDFSCKDSLATVPLMKTTGTFLTVKFSSDSRTLESDGFRFVLTALFDLNLDCPADYSYCQNHLCISKHLFCDEINHCIDGSDESADCSSRFGLGGSSLLGPSGETPFGFSPGSGAGGSLLSANLTNAVLLLGAIILVIVLLTLLLLWCINCRVDQGSAYAQYQHHLQRGIQVPLQSSASLMFANHQPQLHYQYFQPQLSPYVTPQHQQQAGQLSLAGATLPRGYTTLPVKVAAGKGHPGAHQVGLLAAQEAHLAQPAEYLMMTGLSAGQSMQPAQSMQTNLFLPNSQSILAGIRYPVAAPTPLPRAALNLAAGEQSHQFAGRQTAEQQQQ